MATAAQIREKMAKSAERKRKRAIRGYVHTAARMLRDDDFRRNVTVGREWDYTTDPALVRIVERLAESDMRPVLIPRAAYREYCGEGTC